MSFWFFVSLHAAFSFKARHLRCLHRDSHHHQTKAIHVLLHDADCHHKCMQGPGAGYRLHTKQALGFPSPHARAPLLTLASVNKMSILYGFSRLEDPNLVYTFSKSAEERYPWANLFLVVDICPAERFALQTLQTLLQLGRHVGALCIYVDLSGCTLIGHLLSLRPKNLWPGQP